MRFSSSCETLHTQSIIIVVHVGFLTERLSVLLNTPVMWCGFGFTPRWRYGRRRVVQHGPVMRPCPNMVPIRETCTCGRNSSPTANALSGFSQISFCHSMYRTLKIAYLKVYGYLDAFGKRKVLRNDDERHVYIKYNVLLQQQIHLLFH